MQYPLKEYNDLLKLLEKDDLSRENLYQELMLKEQQVLDVSSRIATTHEKNQSINATFINTSLTNIIARFANVWTNIFTEIVENATPDQYRALDPRRLLLKDDRKIYLGIMFILLALLSFFISITQK